MRRESGPLIAVIAGVVGVLVATLVGVALAGLASMVGLTQTPVLRLGAWLGGLGVLGTWTERVGTSGIGTSGWDSTLRFAPVLVTAAAAVAVAMIARWSDPYGRPEWPGALAAAAGAALAAIPLVLVSDLESTTTNAAGTVATDAGLDPILTALGAAVLAGLAWMWAARPQYGAWGEGWRGALSVLLVPGLVLTVIAALGLGWLLGSTTASATLLLLAPLTGVSLLLAAAGAPADVAIPRLTAGEPQVSLADLGTTALVAGVLLAVVVAAIAGSVRALRRPHDLRPRHVLVPTMVWTAGIALVIAAATGIHGALPAGLGGLIAVGVTWWGALLAGAALGALSVLLGTPMAVLVERVRRLRHRRAAAAAPVPAR